jgi:hypothetical protein
MADLLVNALTGLNYNQQETPWGIAQSSLNTLTPQLITPYTSTGRAVGVGLGSILLQSLLGYQARQQAAQDTLAVNSLANQLQTLETPQARTDFIKGVGDTGYQSRLSNLATALTAQETARKAKAEDKMLELMTGYKAQLSPEGTEVFEREQQSLLDRALQQAAASRQPQNQQLPTGVQERIVDASTFSEAAAAHRNKIAEMSPAELKTLLTTGTSMFGLVGEPGFVPENEAIIQLYRKANFGATLTGQEKKAADIITGKTFTASKADILAAWDTLIDQSNKRAKRTIEVATKSPNTIQEMFGAPVAATPTTPIATTPDNDKLKILQQLQAEIAAEKARRGR